MSVLFLVLIAVPAHAETREEKAARILQHVDDMWRGVSSHGRIAMRVQTRNYTRNMKMEVWSKGKERSLIRIVAPLKEKGTATLKSGNDIYTYLPQTDRTIRLNSGMMMGSWMGSHFTNDDLVKESRLLDDYHAAITFEGPRGGQRITEFTLVPKPESPVVWGKIELTVIDEEVPLKELYYDEDMNVVRTMTFSDVKVFDGRRLAAVLHVVPADKPDEFTELVYEDMRFNMKLDDALFSIATLQRK